jgi:hypothetical protein
MEVIILSDMIRNYHAHGGNEWVIGGKLTFLPGATVEGAKGLLDLPAAGEPALHCIAASEATTVATLRESFNQLLTALKAAGIMATEAENRQSE